MVFFDDNDILELTANKFKLIRQEQDFIFPYKISSYKNNVYEKLNHFKHMPTKVFNTLEKNIGEHMLITMKKNQKRT